MTTPVTAPTPYTELQAPYVSVAEFRASPTWLDTNNLIESGNQAQQDAELYNVLLRASTWADNWCGQQLGAHTEFEQLRVRVDRSGQAYMHQSAIPVRQVTGLAFGTDFKNMQVLTDLTQVWVEDQRGIVVSMLPLRGSFRGTLEFGSVPASGQTYMYVQVQYVAGYVSTVLSATANPTDTSINVVNPTGILGPPVTLFGTLPGSVLRIYDPLNPAGSTGGEEAVQVASGYSNGSSNVPIVGAIALKHTVGSGAAGQVLVSEMPAAVHQAVIDFAVALMQKQDVASDEPFADEPYGPAMKRSGSGGASAGLVDHAYELLEPYRRVR